MKLNESKMKSYLDVMKREMMKQWKVSNHKNIETFICESLKSVCDTSSVFMQSSGNVTQDLHRLAIAACFLDMVIHIHTGRRDKAKGKQ